MAYLESLIDKYCEGWSVGSSDQRERLIRESLAEDATYTDPRTARLRIPELLGHISKMHASRPGAKVVRTSNVDNHHDLARFHWQVLMPDGSSLLEGIDVVELSPDGRQIRRIIGFFGPLQLTINS